MYNRRWRRARIRKIKQAAAIEFGVPLQQISYHHGMAFPKGMAFDFSRGAWKNFASEYTAILSR